MATAYSLGRKGGYNIYTGVVYSIVHITTNHLLTGFSGGMLIIGELYVVYALPFRAGESHSLLGCFELCLLLQLEMWL